MRGAKKVLVLLLPLLAVTVGACMAQTEKDSNRPEPRDEAIPAGAIKAGDDLHMVPAGNDPSGCPWYRPFAPGRMVAQAMYYRAADGRFVPSREAADCRR